MSGARFKGLGVSPGLAIGPVHLVDRRRVKIPRRHLDAADRAAEVERFEGAIETAATQLESLRDRAQDADLSQVGMLLEAHQMMLRDDALLGATRRRIESHGQNAEWALGTTLGELKKLFDRLEQDYFRERRSDVDIVGDRLLRILTGEGTDALDGLEEGAVVVAKDLSPADTVSLARKKALAFVTESGGRTSHTAIMARALNIPSVLGAQGILEQVGNGDRIVVDGRTGEVVLQPVDAVLGEYRNLQVERAAEVRALRADRDLPSVTQDGVQVRLLGNVEVSQEIDSVIDNGGTGVGLYRTEFIWLEQPRLDSYLDHYEVYLRMVQQLDGRPCTIRTLDIGGDKESVVSRRRTSSRPSSAVSNPLTSPSPGRRANPALGLRAIRSSLQEPGPFREQLKAILLASAHGPVRLLIPFVTTVEELRAVRSEVAHVRAELDEAGEAYDPNIPIGMMIETPAAAVLADLFAKECDFFAIGTNDLIQFTLATDRTDDQVAYLYRPAHPALLRLIGCVATAADAAGIPVSVCGEMAADAGFAPLLIGLGIRALSVNPNAIPVVKRMIRRLDARACTDLVREASSLASADEVERLLAERLADWAPDLMTAAP